jgi:hypothetical protein
MIVAGQHNCLIFTYVIHDAIHAFKTWIKNQCKQHMNFLLKEGFYKTYKNMQHINNLCNHSTIKKSLFLNQIPHIALEEQQLDVHIPFSSSP